MSYAACARPTASLEKKGARASCGWDKLARRAGHWLAFTALILALSLCWQVSQRGASSVEEEAGEIVRRRALMPRIDHVEGVFAVVGAFHEETPFLREWVEHYIAEGASYIIICEHNDDESEQRELRELLNPYVEMGILEIIPFTHSNAQPYAYNEYAVPRLRELGGINWALYVDVDEYAYGRKGLTFADVLSNVAVGQDMICMPFKIFTSMGAFWEPPCVVPYHTQRVKFEAKQNTKCAVRVSSRGSISIHGAGWSKHMTASEDWLEAQPYHLNHYRSRSLEQFYRKRVNMGRGSGKPIEGPRGSSPEYEIYRGDNQSLVWDFELAQKRHWQTLPCFSDGWGDTPLDEMSLSQDGVTLVDHLEVALSMSQDQCV